MIEQRPPSRVLVSVAMIEPDERARRWVDRIPDERLDELLVAVSAMR